MIAGGGEWCLDAALFSQKQSLHAGGAQSEACYTVSQRQAWETARALGLRRSSSPIHYGSRLGGVNRLVGHRGLIFAFAMRGAFGPLNRYAFTAGSWLSLKDG